MNVNLPQIILEIIDRIRNNALKNDEALIFTAAEQGSANINYLVELSISCAQQGKLTDALIILKILNSKITDQIKIYYNLGLVYSLCGNNQEAAKAYELALRIDPNDTDTLINISSVYNELKEYQHALKNADQAIKVNPQIPEAWTNRGNSLCSLHLFDESIKSYQEACRLNPHLFEAWLNQSLPLNKLGKHHEALVTCDEALRLQPSSDKAHSDKAITFNELGQYNQALIHFDKATHLNPNLAENFFGKGVAFHKLCQLSKALSEYNKAIGLNPHFSDAYYQKGVTLSQMKCYREAIVELKKALEIDPNKPDYWFSMGATYLELSQALEARLHFQKALDLNPEFFPARWTKAFTYIPTLLSEDEDLEFLRNQFLLELNLLNESIPDNKLDGLHKVVGMHQPFYLAYQNLNNKELLKEYGLICDRFMHYWQLKNQIGPSKKIQFSKIKIGIVSSHIYDHSVWHAITKGFLSNLDTNRFEVHLFYLGAVFDAETNFAKLKSTSFSNGESSLLSWAKLISDKNIDALIYPEIGMHQLTTQLASLRLSDLQMVAWGHPETTGLPTIDYYLSGELYEPQGIDAYTETLIQLPNLASCYYRIPITPVQPVLEGISFDEEAPILLCPGTPYKYDPKNDWILVEIAKRLGKCKLVFFHHHEDLSQKLKLRLTAKFTAAKLSIDEFVVFIPWLNSSQFYGLMGKSSVFLDTIGFSGFNTAIQAIDCTLPIVTKDDRFMRGRLAVGLLRRIGLSRLIASDDAEYIELAVQLTQDQQFSGEVRKQMHQMKHLLYEDTSVVRALEAFLINKLRRPSSNPAI